MPRFVTERDMLFFQHINRELIMDVVDVPVILYKIILDVVSVNVYGESTTKPRYRGINLQGFIKYSKFSGASEGFGFDSNQQNVEFRFARKLLQDVNVYPETGDLIGYNSNFYEINIVNEVQLIANRPEYNHAVICNTHLTRKSNINIEETHI